MPSVKHTAEQRPAHRGGRPLDPTRDAAILQAALDGLAELGYDRLSMDEIAARAHAGKGALYRRWPSKAALVIDAILAWREAQAPIEAPDTGSLRGDLDAMIQAVPEFDDAAKQQIAVFHGLATAANRDPELKAAFSTQLLQRPRRVIGEVLERAVARGEIPADQDLELIPDIIIGLNLVRMVTGEFPDRSYVQRVLRTIIYPLLTGKSGR
ncbi:MAG: TetR/AcrR family transcriptional regulator [Solirubrobacteraceae bacterium]